MGISAHDRLAAIAEPWAMVRLRVCRRHVTILAFLAGLPNPLPVAANTDAVRGLSPSEVRDHVQSRGYRPGSPRVVPGNPYIAIHDADASAERHRVWMVSVHADKAAATAAHLTHQAMEARVGLHRQRPAAGCLRLA
jgi:hypothetical protein